MHSFGPIDWPMFDSFEELIAFVYTPSYEDFLQPLYSRMDRSTTMNCPKADCLSFILQCLEDAARAVPEEFPRGPTIRDAHRKFSEIDRNGDGCLDPVEFTLFATYTLGLLHRPVFGAAGQEAAHTAVHQYVKVLRETLTSAHQQGESPLHVGSPAISLSTSLHRQPSHQHGGGFKGDQCASREESGRSFASIPGAVNSST